MASRHFNLDDPRKRINNLTGYTLQKKRRELFKLLRRHVGAEALYVQDYLLLGMLDGYFWDFPGLYVQNNEKAEFYEDRAKKQGYADFNDMHKSLGYRHIIPKLLNSLSGEHKQVRTEVLGVIASWLVHNDFVNDFVHELERNRKWGETKYGPAWSKLEQELRDNTQAFYDKLAVNIALSKLEDDNGN